MVVPSAVAAHRNDKSSTENWTNRAGACGPMERVWDSFVKVNRWKGIRQLSYGQHTDDLKGHPQPICQYLLKPVLSDLVMYDSIGSRCLLGVPLFRGGSASLPRPRLGLILATFCQRIQPLRCIAEPRLRAAPTMGPEI